MKPSHALVCAALLICSAALGQETRESPMRGKVRDWLESARISGTVAYRFEGPAKDAAVMFRVTRRLEESVISFNNVNDLSDQGTIPFSIGPTNSGEGQVAFGPMPVFIELVMAGEGGTATVASNTIALLLDVRPDLDAFARLSIGVFDKFTDILATVQDRASGAKAIEAYKQLATRNAALVEAMERLAPTKEQDAEIERKYGAKMDAAARRMQEQMTRIEQAEYGPAFFEQAKKAAEKK